MVLALAGCSKQREVNEKMKFDTSSFKKESLTIDGQTITYRAYENIVYVANPVEPEYQAMNVYVPEAYFNGESIDGYTEENAPIFFPNGVGGYMPAKPGKIGEHHGGQAIDASFTAIQNGLVVVSPGARGRTLKDDNSNNTGKAPAAIVDLKAAVRYLHYNDKLMPGDAERIISNGTSAGGGLSVLLGATGNNKEYEPYLKEAGALDARDDIFAVSAYCPITNLDHADMAYEWQFNGVNDYKSLKITQGTDFHIKREFVTGTMSDVEIRLSQKLAASFPAYINSLKLKGENGTLLTLDENGNGSFKDYYLSIVQASAQKALDSGVDLSSCGWLTVDGSTVTAVDFDKYVEHVGRMKTTPAFDGVNLSTGENDLFGTGEKDAQHFTRFSRHNSTANGTLADSAIIRLMNPMYYIGAKGTTLPQEWRIRHGEIDSDTSLAVSAIVAAKLKNEGYTVDYASPWATPHSGDYDLNELFGWIADITKK